MGIHKIPLLHPHPDRGPAPVSRPEPVSEFSYPELFGSGGTGADRAMQLAAGYTRHDGRAVLLAA